MTLLKFNSAYLIFVGILIGIITLLPTLFPNTQLIMNDFWPMFIFFTVITYTAYVLVYLGIKRNPESGILAIMGSIAVKMIFCLAFVLIYRLKDPNLGMIFVINFFSLYLLFTAFEIYCLLRNLRHQN